MFILRDGVKIGETTNTDYEDLSGLWSNKEYNYNIVTVDSTGNLGYSKNQVIRTLSRSITWSGGEAYIFDKIDNKTITTSGNTTITWTGSLVNKEVYIITSGTHSYSITRISVLDSVGNPLSFYDNINNKYINYRDINGSTKTITRIIIPESAASIRISDLQQSLAGASVIHEIYESGF